MNTCEWTSYVSYNERENEQSEWANVSEQMWVSKCEWANVSEQSEWTKWTNVSEQNEQMWVNKMNKCE